MVGLLCGMGSIIGIVLGAIAINQIKQTRQGGYGLAVAGIVVGVASLVISIVWMTTWMTSGAHRSDQAGGTNGGACRAIPAARPLLATTSAILRLASSIISSPSITAPRAPPAFEVCHS